MFRSQYSSIVLFFVSHFVEETRIKIQMKSLVFIPQLSEPPYIRGDAGESLNGGGGGIAKN